MRPKNVKQIPYSDQKTSKLFHEIKSHIENFDTTIEIDLTDTHKDVDGYPGNLAIEINEDIIIKGTKVDGVYSADPEIDPDAKKFDSLTFKEVIDKELRVMDLTAVTLCKENNLPIIVFDIKSKNGLVDIVNSVPIGTTVS